MLADRSRTGWLPPIRTAPAPASWRATNSHKKNEGWHTRWRRSARRHAWQKIPSGSHFVHYDGTDTDEALREAQRGYDGTGAIPYVPHRWDGAVSWDPDGRGGGRRPSIEGDAEARLRADIDTAAERMERPERAFSAPNGITGVGVIVVNDRGDVLLGLAHDGRWELPGGKVDPGESFEQAAVRELAEETGLHADPSGTRIIAVVLDGARGVTRISAAALVPSVAGQQPRVSEPDKIVRWEWHLPGAVPSALYAPSVAVLRAWRQDLELPRVDAHCYPTSVVAPRR
jgi:8-oxo-dGTP diphosphatase